MPFEILSFGDCIKPGKYKLHSSFKRVKNFQKGSRLVSFVLPEIGPGPDNVVVNLLPSVREIEIKKKEIIFEESRSPLPAYPYVSNNLPSLRRLKLKSLPDCFLNNFLQLAPPLSMAFVFDSEREKKFSSAFEKKMLERMKKGIRYLKDGKIYSGARTLFGLGFGLTPSGDDFLSGFSLFLRLKGGEERSIKSLLSACRGGNLITSNFLKNSAAGRSDISVKLFIQNLVSGKSADIEKSMVKLLKRGHNSGADFLSGFLFPLFIKDFKNL